MKYFFLRASDFILHHNFTPFFQLQYINDLEKDAKYRRWPSSIQEMLRPTFPGMLRHIAKNIFHMVGWENPLLLSYLKL